MWNKKILLIWGKLFCNLFQKHYSSKLYTTLNADDKFRHGFRVKYTLILPKLAA